MLDGRWITQIASVDGDVPGARESVLAELSLLGATYTYSPAGCSVFNQTRNYYVIYLGTFATEEEADATCTASGDGDCFPRQLNPLRASPCRIWYVSSRSAVVSVPVGRS